MPPQPPRLGVGRASYAVELLDTPGDDIKALIAQTVWGTPGGLRYRNKSTRWDRLRAPKIFEARDETGTLVAAVVFAGMRCGYYLAAVAALPGRARAGLALRLCNYGMQRLQPCLVEGQAFVGLVVSDNRAARQMIAQSGIQAQLHLDAILFSRRWPRGSRCCRRLRPGDRQRVLAELAALGRGWQDAEATLVDEECFVCEEDGRLVAGLQACRQTLEVQSLGSSLDPLLFRLLTLLLGETPGNFRYLQVFHLWGRRNAIGELCSHVLRELDARLACIQLDPADPLWHAIRHGLRHGIAARLIGVDSIQIVATGPVPRPLSVTPLMGTFA